MIVFSIEEFTARRRKTQESLEERLLPTAISAFQDFLAGDPDWADKLMQRTEDAWFATYETEGGNKSGIREARRFARRVEETLAKTTEDSLPSNIATWLATAILNSATLAAANDDPEPLVLEWVTMNDSDVRDTHQAAEGQRRTPGEPFQIGGHDLLYPGDSSAPIEEWINCRCALAPALASEAEEEIAASAATDEGAGMDDDNQEIAPATPWHGILAPEGIMSGDGRMFAPESLTFRDLPLPLTWQKTQQGGHDGSTVVARIDTLERVPGEVEGTTMMRASGVFLQNVEADEVIGMIAEFGKFGVSVDADSAEFEFDEDTESVVFNKARIASASIVSIPAFAEAWVALGHWPEEEPTAEAEVEDDSDEEVTEDMVAAAFKRGAGWLTNPADTKRLHDYWTKPGKEGYAKIDWGTPGDFNRCRVLVGEKIAENSPEDSVFLNQICARWHKDALGIWPGEHKAAADTLDATEAAPALSLVASGGWCAPSEFFKDPELKALTPHTIKGEHVFGHVAGFETCHIAYEGVCQSAPHSYNDYADFLLGELPLDDGTTVMAGNLTIGGGHAPSGLRARAAAAHYDDVSSVFAYVVVGEDEFGIWYSGCLKPGLTPEQITEAKMAKISGDWRDFGGPDLSLVAAHAVNTPGFPIPRMQVAASNGRQISLVAAGVVDEQRPAPTLDIQAIAAAVVQEINATNTRKTELAALAARVNGD